ARDLAVRTRCGRGACGLDEVRPAPRRASLGLLSRRARPAAREVGLRRGPRRGDARRLLDPLARAAPARSGARVLEADRELAGAARLALLDLGLAAVPRGPPGPAPLAVGARGRPRRRRRRRLLPPAPQVAAAARRSHRRPPARVRDSPDPLVLPLPALVLPLRRVRGARAGAGPAAGTRPG